MEEFEVYGMVCDMDDQQKYIRIRMIGLGAVASDICVDSSLYNDTKGCSITKEKDISEDRLKHFVDDSDIVFSVADMDDDFVVENILKITEILSNRKKLFVTILANIDSAQDNVAWILKDIREKSSVLIVENQEDIGINTDTTVDQKFTRIISELYDLIDEEIEVIKMPEDTFSSLINMISFFDQKCELYLYVNYTKKQIENISSLEILFEESNQVWVRCPFNEGDNTEIYAVIEFIEINTYEDVSLYLSNKKSTNKSIDEMEFTMLVSVSMIVSEIKKGKHG